ncbi:unnamed protein product [Lasius platythorax]|uniref:Uncharacterized protein n=1 Tax=Lasius platythorax TaxID=488582 RepID=A0AAV2P992_9HYME
MRKQVSTTWWFITHLQEQWKKARAFLGETERMVKAKPFEEEHVARSYGTYLRKFRTRGRIADVAGGAKQF